MTAVLGKSGKLQLILGVYDSIYFLIKILWNVLSVTLSHFLKRGKHTGFSKRATYVQGYHMAGIFNSDSKIIFYTVLCIEVPVSHLFLK